MSTNVTVRAPLSEADRQAILRIRHVVFVQEQSVSSEEEFDRHDATALHLLALVDGQPTGTGRMVLDPERRGKIGRMAVLKAGRGAGVGSALLRAFIALGRQQGVSELYLDSQLHAIPFYRRLGFVEEGEEFLDANIAHRRMRLPLASAR